MKLLIVTQKVDIRDDILGFFHRWIEECAKRFEAVTVICLEKGSHTLPASIPVLSLGKEQNKSRFTYLIRFYRYIWQTRRNYDVVLVHMNQEYVILGGLLWRMWGKKIGLWRNHPMGNLFTRIAVALSHMVFCTSPYSFTAPFPKTLLMPVGIDTEEFRPIGGARLPDSLVFFGRLTPIKKPEILIEALHILKQKNNLVSKTMIIGNAADAGYLESLTKKVSALKLHDYITFNPALPHQEVPTMLSKFEAYINTTPTGSMDKTIFEAMACETLAVVSNRALIGDIPDFLIFKENDPQSLGQTIEHLFLKSSTERRNLGIKLRQYVIKNHSLTALMDKLYNTYEVFLRK